MVTQAIFGILQIVRKQQMSVAFYYVQGLERTEAFGSLLVVYHLRVV